MKKTKQIGENISSFLVKTKGYKETFNTLEKARNQFEILKKRFIKNKSRVKIELFERVGKELTLVDEVLITEAFYGEE